MSKQTQVTPGLALGIAAGMAVFCILLWKGVSAPPAAEPPTITLTEAVAPPPAPPAATKPPEKRNPTPRELSVMKHFRDGFKETTWFNYITSVECFNDQLTVQTSLPPLPRGSEMRGIWENEAKGICAGASSLIYTNGSKLNLNKIRVVDTQGSTYIRRNNFNDTCK